MVQPANHRDPDDTATIPRFDIPRDRRVAGQRQMRPGGVVVSEVFGKHLPQVVLAENDDMVEAVVPDGSNQPLDVGRLPVTSSGDSDFLECNVSICVELLLS